MEWRNLYRVHKQQERLPEGRVHAIGRGGVTDHEGSLVDELGARPVQVAIDVASAGLSMRLCVIPIMFTGRSVYIPALREREARLRGAGPCCLSNSTCWNEKNLKNATAHWPNDTLFPPGPDERPPPEFEVLVSDEIGRLTMQDGLTAAGSAWFRVRRANGVDGALRGLRFTILVHPRGPAKWHAQRSFRHG
jgi:hypothetical protein